MAAEKDVDAQILAVQEERQPCCAAWTTLSGTLGFSGVNG